MRPAILPILAVALLAFLGRGCADGTPEIWISSNVVLPSSCTIDAGLATSGAQRTRGIMDVYLRSNYVMFPAFRSTIFSSGSVTPAGGSPRGVEGSRWEANRIMLTRAEIRYDGPDGIGVALPATRRISIAATIEPGSAAVSSFEVIDARLWEVLSESPLLQNPGDSYQINVRLRVFGTTASGNDVDSNEFVFPIEICMGCLIHIPTDAIDITAEVTPNCRNLDQIGEAREVCEGIRGQDEPVDCRLICPALTALPGGDPLGVCEPAF